MYLHSTKEIKWNYDEAQHGKTPMDGLSGTIKNKIFEKLKSGRIVLTTPEAFSNHAIKLVESVMTFYIPMKSSYHTLAMWKMRPTSREL